MDRPRALYNRTFEKRKYINGSLAHLLDQGEIDARMFAVIGQFVSDAYLATFKDEFEAYLKSKTYMNSFYDLQAGRNIGKVSLAKIGMLCHSYQIEIDGLPPKDILELGEIYQPRKIHIKDVVNKYHSLSPEQYSKWIDSLEASMKAD